jgi:hypothetical protein
MDRNGHVRMKAHIGFSNFFAFRVRKWNGRKLKWPILEKLFFAFCLRFDFLIFGKMIHFGLLKSRPRSFGLHIFGEMSFGQSPDPLCSTGHYVCLLRPKCGQCLVLVCRCTKKKEDKILKTQRRYINYPIRQCMLILWVVLGLVEFDNMPFGEWTKLLAILA